MTFSRVYGEVCLGARTDIDGAKAGANQTLNLPGAAFWFRAAKSPCSGRGKFSFLLGGANREIDNSWVRPAAAS